MSLLATVVLDPGKNSLAEPWDESRVLLRKERKKERSQD